MRKSVLVLETPRNCYECPFSCANGNDTDCGYCELEMYFGDGEVVINEEYFDFESKVKPDWCPLRTLPGKNRAPKVADGYELGYAKGYEKGWSDCFNEITGETK